jgi:hypothetical protein
MKRLGTVVVALIVCLPLAAQAQQKVLLRYQPALDATGEEKLSAELLDAVAQGQSLGVKGSAQADVETKVTAVNAEAKTVTVRLSVTKLEANLNGQAQRPTPPDPLSITVDELGQMTLPQGEPGAPADFMQTGGVPLYLIAILAHNLRLPENEVAVGEEWQYQDSYCLPGMGNVALTTRWKLMQLEGDTATIASTAAATIPDFQAPNPMAPGTMMDVREAKLSVTAMTQEYSLPDSRLLSSQATLCLDAKLDMGGFQVPLVLSLKFALECD